MRSYFYMISPVHMCIALAELAYAIIPLNNKALVPKKYYLLLAAILESPQIAPAIYIHHINNLMWHLFLLFTNKYINTINKIYTTTYCYIFQYLYVMFAMECVTITVRWVGREV